MRSSGMKYWCWKYCCWTLLAPQRHEVLLRVLLLEVPPLEVSAFQQPDILLRKYCNRTYCSWKYCCWRFLRSRSPHTAADLGVPLAGEDDAERRRGNAVVLLTVATNC